ncbi:MAG TPA: prepilin-type N-terminal cleavage/methylation domain-containing protein [Cellvibrio sp.]|nr:prepilin-type N-terminal cleavage/methylation domain-containing protein [Cellvibrio sp.]
MAPYILNSKGICERKKWRRLSGFTLIELITVVVILSLIATIGTSFVVRTTETYQRTQTRALILNTSRQALERITRQLRIALPFSVRITNSGSCVEFMPIAAGGNYFDPVSDNTNMGPDRSTIPASPVPVPADFGTPVFVTIGAMDSTEIYGAGAVSREGYAGYAGGNLTLAAARRWQRNSLNRRYYLLDNPQAFCVVGNELRFYSGININDANVTVTAAHNIIARNVSATTPFTLVAGNNNRNTALDITLVFAASGESMSYTQRVLIRNVP